MIEQLEERKIPVQPQSEVIRIINSSVGEDQGLAFVEQEHNVEPVIAPLSLAIISRYPGKYVFGLFVRAASL